MLQLEFLGEPRVVLDGRTVTFLRRGSVGLLAYLVLSARAHAREALATFLAGDNSDAQARKYLSNVLVDLRRVLGDYIIATRQTVTFDRTLPHRVDVLGFEQAFPDALDRQSIAELDATASMYRGEFLESVYLAGAPDFEAWLSAQREHLRGQFIQLLHAQTELSLKQANWLAGIASARRLLSEEPWLEEVHRDLVLMLAAAGEREAALEQYGVCCQVLQAELGVAPLATTTALYNRIRAASSPMEHNLPPTSGRFLGRAGELQQVISLLRDPQCRMVTIVGLGGSGKTRLAVEVARGFVTPEFSVLDQPFSDGVVFVSYADQGAPRSTVLSAVEQTIGSSITDLTSKAILLVLDNLENGPDASHALSALLDSAPNIKLLVTARAPVHAGAERVLHIDGLDLEDAQDLFFDQARGSADEMLRSRDCVLEICRVLSGLPLAVILAARLTGVMSCAGILKRIATNLDVLVTTEGDLPERHRSIERIRASTLAQLSSDERELTEAIVAATLDGSHAARNARSCVPRHLLHSLRPLTERSLVSVDAKRGTVRLHPLFSGVSECLLDAGTKGH